jgi:hypothetical protein
MSYDLDLYFEPAVSRSRILQYFTTRKRYTIEENNAVYQNPDTGVYFFMRLRCARSILLQKNVVAAELEINYHRPSFFGTEAEIELSALVAAFQPRIQDPQMRGMGEGPYSGEGFLNGWNFGNVFGTRVGLSNNPGRDIASMPADRLRAAWAWNYRLAEHQRRNPDCFVPTIRFFRIDRRASTVVAWGDGMPVLLPKVDYVVVGRSVSGEPRFGLAPWSAVAEIVERAGFATTNDPLTLAYSATPLPIANWVPQIPMIDLGSLEQLRADQILDDELIAAAKESIERDKDDPSIMTIPSNS